MSSESNSKFEYDVFISYSSKDKDWVRGELLTQVEAQGLRTFIDFRDFQIGAPSIKEMQRGVQTCRRTLLVLTPDYVDSAWTEFEVMMRKWVCKTKRHHQRNTLTAAHSLSISRCSSAVIGIRCSG